MANTTKFVKSSDHPILLDKESLPLIISSLEIYEGLVRNGGSKKSVDEITDLINYLKQQLN